MHVMMENDTAYWEAEQRGNQWLVRKGKANDGRRPTKYTCTLKTAASPEKAQAAVQKAADQQAKKGLAPVAVEQPVWQTFGAMMAFRPDDVFATADLLERGEVDREVIATLVRKGSVNSLAYLVEAGQSMDKRLIDEAGFDASGASLAFLLGQGLKPSENVWVVAAQKGKVKVLKALFENGLSVNVKTRDSGATPLICAVIGGQTKAVELLLSLGADVSIQTTSESAYPERTALSIVLGFAEKADQKEQSRAKRLPKLLSLIDTLRQAGALWMAGDEAIAARLGIAGAASGAPDTNRVPEVVGRWKLTSFATNAVTVPAEGHLEFSEDMHFAQEGNLMVDRQGSWQIFGDHVKVESSGGVTFQFEIHKSGSLRRFGHDEEHDMEIIETFVRVS